MLVSVEGGWVGEDSIMGAYIDVVREDATEASEEVSSGTIGGGTATGSGH